MKIGAEWLPYPSPELPRTRFFGAIIDASHDGTYHLGTSLVLSWTAPGLSFIFTAGTLHLRSNRSGGTFSGLIGGRDIYADGITTGSASGSFSC